jgi:hypothetical protein
MPFQVKATVTGFLGDIERYPCHFGHVVGDEFLYDGEKYVGRLCPSMGRILVPEMMPFHAIGPRVISPPRYYYPFQYSPMSRKAPENAKYDGIGFRNVLETPNEPPYHMTTLFPNPSVWPPPTERTILKPANSVVCSDIRSAMVMKIEAFDLSDKGYDICYFRREMVILDRITKKQEIPTGVILDEFSKKEIEEIYPALSPILVECLIEELQLMGYVETADGKARATDKGRAKVEAFKASLSGEEREALHL